jgi:cytochrome c-type protein NapC
MNKPAQAEKLEQKGLIARSSAFVAQPSSRFSLGALVVIGGVLGVLFWGGFNWAMEVANTESFCISCHEMRDNVYKELQTTIHFKNRSGVRATCPDCHVPHEWIHKVIRKIQASNELFHKVMGTVDTSEKFNAHRKELAEYVWASMKATDSRECRNCHSAVSMEPAKQSPAAAAAMQAGFSAGMTCIDCHKGIAHKLPQ